MIVVTINGSTVETSGLRIVQALTHSPDTCSFTLYAPDTVPEAGQEVYCYLDSTSGDVLFGGVIVSVTQAKLAPNEIPSNRLFKYIVECQDFSRVLDRHLVANSYSSKNSAEIIDDIITNYVDTSFGFTTNNVETSRTITRVVFNYIPVSQAISELADLLNWDWYVDYSKDIHFFEKESRPAPFSIDDDAVNNKIDNLQIIPDYSQVRNRVYVRGGYYLSSEYTDKWVADGQSRIWALGYSPHEPSSLTINGTPKTFAVDHLYPDDGTYEFFWNYSEKYLRCAENPGTTPTPSSGDVIEFKYKYEVPIIVRVDNTVSQAAIAALEGGNGIYESIIRDETIDSLELAHDRGLAEVNQFGNVQINGSFTTYESGFKQGQYIDFSVSGYESFHGKYQVQRVTIVPEGPHAERYTVEFATTLYELKDFLLSLVRDRTRLKLREDETVDILKVINESITVTDSVSLSLEAHPTKWGVPQWGFATWG